MIKASTILGLKISPIHVIGTGVSFQDNGNQIQLGIFEKGKILRCVFFFSFSMLLSVFHPTIFSLFNDVLFFPLVHELQLPLCDTSACTLLVSSHPSLISAAD